MKRDIRITAYVSEEMYRRLQRTAFAHEVTASAIVVDALSLWFKKLEGEDTVTPPFPGQVEMTFNGPQA
jgi:hypothetical protein